MVKHLVLFAVSALISAFFLVSPDVTAGYRVIPAQLCTGIDPPRTVGDCGVPTGSEFLIGSIGTIEVDFYSTGAFGAMAMACRQSWNGSTETCSPLVAATKSGAFSLFPAASYFNTGSIYDYRSVWWSTAIAGKPAVLGVYVTN